LYEKKIKIGLGLDQGPRETNHPGSVVALRSEMGFSDGGHIQTFVYVKHGLYQNKPMPTSRRERDNWCRFI